jgi:hypothetical protein
MSEQTRMPLEELRLTPEFQKLTQKQQLFCSTYCAGGIADGTYDAVLATHTAYACKSMEVARIMSYSMMANIRIISVLNRHFNTTPTQELLVQIDRAINNKKLTVAQLNALKLKCDLLGLSTGLIGPTYTRPSAVPNDVQEASKAVRKSKRKPRATPAPKESPKSQFDGAF